MSRMLMVASALFLILSAAVVLAPPSEAVPCNLLEPDPETNYFCMLGYPNEVWCTNWQNAGQLLERRPII